MSVEIIVEILNYVGQLFAGTIILYLFSLLSLFMIEKIFKTFSTSGWFFYDEDDKVKSGRNKFEFKSSLTYYYREVLTQDEYHLDIKTLTLEYIKHNSLFIKLNGDWVKVTKGLIPQSPEQKYKYVQIPLTEFLFTVFIWKILLYILLYKIIPTNLRTSNNIKMNNSNYLNKKCQKILDMETCNHSIFNEK